jgi:hypothetical protein
MTSILDLLLNQTAWYWTPSSTPDKFGVYTPATTPVEIPCQWEQDNSVVATPDGKTVPASAIVSLSQSVVRQGWLMLKTSDTPPSSPDKDFWIKKVVELQDTEDDEHHWEVYV